MHAECYVRAECEHCNVISCSYVLSAAIERPNTWSAWPRSFRSEALLAFKTQEALEGLEVQSIQFSVHVL